jgi:hypothetical protein
LAICSFGCGPLRDEAEVYGSYELTTSDVKIALNVAANHSYTETLTFSNGSDQKNAGAWQWREGRVCFNGLLVPTVLMKALEGAPQEDRPKVVGQSYQMDHCIPAGKEYGKTILELNPDSPENFVKARSTTAPK